VLPQAKAGSERDLNTDFLGKGVGDSHHVFVASSFTHEICDVRWPSRTWLIFKTPKVGLYLITIDPDFDLVWESNIDPCER